MQLFMTGIAIVVGLVFSFAVALLVEEVIFGKVLRVLFTRPAAIQVKSAQKSQA